MDAPDLRALRSAYRELLASNPAPSPSDEELAALVAGDLDPHERDRVAGRMLRSAEALEKVSILRDLHAHAQQRAPARRRWSRIAGLAAALVAAVVLLQLVPIQPIEPGPRSGNETVMTAAEPSGNARLAAPPPSYRWRAEPAAHRYRITVFDDAGLALWRSDWTTEAQVMAPPAGELALPGGARYFWVVDIDGAAPRERLGPYWFRIE